jgi:DNA-binding transcriptional MerR regulator
MSVLRALRTSDLAREAGLSVQMIRNYERLGFIPPAERSSSGYRRYGQRHLAALRTARVMIVGHTWQRAHRILAAAHQGNLGAALALVDERHAELDHLRRAAGQTLAALRAIADSLPYADEPVGAEPYRTVGEVARQLGVRVSALRFWEQQGFVAPARDPSSRYRRYTPEQVRRLRVVVLLRQGGYTAEVIREVLAEVAGGRPERAITAAEARLADLNTDSRHCARATAAFWAYVESHLGDGPGLPSAFAALDERF